MISVAQSLIKHLREIRRRNVTELAYGQPPSRIATFSTKCFATRRPAIAISIAPWIVSTACSVVAREKRSPAHLPNFLVRTPASEQDRSLGFSELAEIATQREAQSSADFAHPQGTQLR